MSDEDQPFVMDGRGRDTRAATAAWLRGLVRRYGIKSAARYSKVSTEALARYCAGFEVRHTTAERLERSSYQLRQCREAHRVEIASGHDPEPSATEEGGV